MWGTVAGMVGTMLLLHRSDTPTSMVQIEISISSLCHYVEIIRVALSNVGSISDRHTAEEIVNH